MRGQPAKPWYCRTEGCGYQLGRVEGRTLIPAIPGRVDTLGSIVVQCPRCAAQRRWVPERGKAH